MKLEILLSTDYAPARHARPQDEAGGCEICGCIEPPGKQMKENHGFEKTGRIKTESGPSRRRIH
jgi:hypothetical protein